LRRREIGEHPVHVLLLEILAVGTIPALVNCRVLGERLDVEISSQPHRPARLLHRNLDALVLEDFDKADGWR
jgi:hypothetical protein